MNDINFLYYAASNKSILKALKITECRLKICKTQKWNDVGKLTSEISRFALSSYITIMVHEESYD